MNNIIKFILQRKYVAPTVSRGGSQSRRRSSGKRGLRGGREGEGGKQPLCNHLSQEINERRKEPEKEAISFFFFLPLTLSLLLLRLLCVFAQQPPREESFMVYFVVVVDVVAGVGGEAIWPWQTVNAS